MSDKTDKEKGQDKDKGNDKPKQKIEEEQAEEEGESLLVMRSILDAQLETKEKRKIGRVADIQAEIQPDGRLVLTEIITGPQALAGRFASHLRPLFTWLLRDRFESRIDFKEVDNFGPTLYLRGSFKDYQSSRSDRWLREHIFRYIPGSGYREEKQEETQPEEGDGNGKN